MYSFVTSVWRSTARSALFIVSPYVAHPPRSRGLTFRVALVEHLPSSVLDVGVAGNDTRYDAAQGHERLIPGLAEDAFRQSGQRHAQNQISQLLHDPQLQGRLGGPHGLQFRSSAFDNNFGLLGSQRSVLLDVVSQRKYDGHNPAVGAIQLDISDVGNVDDFGASQEHDVVKEPVVEVAHTRNDGVNFRRHSYFVAVVRIHDLLDICNTFAESEQFATISHSRRQIGQLVAEVAILFLQKVGEHSSNVLYRLRGFVPSIRRLHPFDECGHGIELLPEDRRRGRRG